MDGSATVKQYPVVLRFAGLYPHHLAGYEAHRTRKGGDLGHVDLARSFLNQPLIGEENWAAQALAEINDMTTENFAAELESLERRKRRKDIKRRMVEGPKQPWRPTRHGPMREVILTVNREWFEGDLGTFFGEAENTREVAFGDRAKEWLLTNFGDDVIHARADRDEAAYHIHAVIMPRATVKIAKPKAKTKVATATRRMLQPSIHPLIEDYEAAQDSVGAWFKDLGLVRGEERAAAIRKAHQDGETPPKKRYHTHTARWRADEDLRLAAERKVLEAKAAEVEQREADADAVLAIADGIGAGALTIDDTGSASKLTMATGPDVPPTTDPETLDALKRRAPRGTARAAAAFGAAWQRLAGMALQTAKTQAQAGVAKALEEITAADDVIVEIARRMPPTDRDGIAKARRGLTARIAGLGRWLGGDKSSRAGSRPGNLEAEGE